MLGTRRPIVDPVLTGVVLAVVLLPWAAWRAGLLRARRVVATGVLVAVAVGAGVVGAPAVVGATDRLVVRDEIVPPFDPRDYPSPLSAFREFVKEDAPLFTVSGLPDGARVRLATMDRYDGVVWNVAGDGSAQASGGVPSGRHEIETTGGASARTSSSQSTSSPASGCRRSGRRRRSTSPTRTRRAACATTTRRGRGAHRGRAPTASTYGDRRRRAARAADDGGRPRARVRRRPAGARRRAGRRRGDRRGRRARRRQPGADRAALRDWLAEQGFFSHGTSRSGTHVAVRSRRGPDHGAARRRPHGRRRRAVRRGDGAHGARDGAALAGRAGLRPGARRTASRRRADRGHRQGHPGLGRDRVPGLRLGPVRPDAAAGADAAGGGPGEAGGAGPAGRAAAAAPAGRGHAARRGHRAAPDRRPGRAGRRRRAVLAGRPGGRGRRDPAARARCAVPRDRRAQGSSPASAAAQPRPGRARGGRVGRGAGRRTGPAPTYRWAGDAQRVGPRVGGLVRGRAPEVRWSRPASERSRGRPTAQCSAPGAPRPSRSRPTGQTSRRPST